MYFEVFKFIVIFAGYELNPLKQVKYKTIYKMRKVSLALLLCLLCLAGMAQGQKALDLKILPPDASARKIFRESSPHQMESTTHK